MTKASLFDHLCAEQTLFEAWKLVKTKNAAGGIDGITVSQYEKDIDRNISSLAEELHNRRWSPSPYLRVEIPKKDNEKRQLGMLTIKDKIVQQALVTLIQPKFERLFVNNSYGYRPGKGPVKAIHRTASMCGCRRNTWVLRLDIDNFFDTIDHTILFSRLQHYISDTEILRLVQLCVQMGAVTKKNRWQPTNAGVPQGAVLSPLLANFYLHPFDQFVLTETDSYVRYADDFVACCSSKESADMLLQQITSFLDTRLHLKLNEPIVQETTQPFEFLGIQISRLKLSLTEKKSRELKERIESYRLQPNGILTDDSIMSYVGIANYYGQLLPQPLLEQLDDAIIQQLEKLVTENHSSIAGKNIIYSWLPKVGFLSVRSKMDRKNVWKHIVESYSKAKRSKAIEESNKRNDQIVNQRKIEYHRKEAESSELIVNTMGSYIGTSEGNLTIRVQKKLTGTYHLTALRHITVLSRGVSLSSNAVDLCMENKVPIDFFDIHGKHKASIISPRWTDTRCWAAQASMPENDRFLLAKKILLGKVKNQTNLVKYFDKYHAKAIPFLAKEGDDTINQLTLISSSIKESVFVNEYKDILMAFEAQAALVYWDYVRQLVADDEVSFHQRVHQGATDLFNSMLNYGYGLLYARVWQALLAVHLNPYDSVLHVRQPGKPTLVYDVVELFRSQTVDRIVIAMVQKHLPLEMENDRLSSDTRVALATNILERFNRYEKYRGEEIRFEQIILRQATEISLFITEHKTFRPYIAKW